MKWKSRDVETHRRGNQRTKTIWSMFNLSDQQLSTSDGFLANLWSSHLAKEDTVPKAKSFLEIKDRGLDFCGWSNAHRSKTRPRTLTKSPLREPKCLWENKLPREGLLLSTWPIGFEWPLSTRKCVKPPCDGCPQEVFIVIGTVMIGTETSWNCCEIFHAVVKDCAAGLTPRVLLTMDRLQ